MGKVPWKLHKGFIALRTEKDHLAGLIRADNKGAAQLRNKFGKRWCKGTTEGRRRLRHDRGEARLEICILEVLDIPVLISYKGVKIAVTIDINSRGSCIPNHGSEAEGNGYRCSERRRRA